MKDNVFELDEGIFMKNGVFNTNPRVDDVLKKENQKKHIQQKT